MKKNHEENYLDNIRKLFRYYKSLGDKTLAQVSDQEIHFQPHPEANNISIIVKHIHGNMMSRWSDFLNSDGEKDFRQRDDEFVDSVADKEGLLKLWEEGWACLFEAIDPLTEADLDKIAYIRNEGHSVIEAANRQLAHYSYHIGQIVFLGTVIRGKEWQSLSIPKGNSKAFNQEKFEQEKQRKNFI